MSNISKDNSFIGGIANQIFTGDTQFNAVNYIQATDGIIADLSTGIVTREFTPSIQNPFKILPVGDSITYGFTNTEIADKPKNNDSGGYRNFLNQFLIADGFGEAVEFVGSQKTGAFEDNEHEGYGGKRIQFISDNITGWLNARQPDMLLLMIGTNDTKSDTNPSTADDRLSSLLDKITNQSPNAHVLVASIPPLDPSLRQTQSDNAKIYNAQIPGIVEGKLAAGKKLTFVDVNKALTVDDIFDGVHPSLEGYEKIANTWYDWIKSSQDTLININNLVGTAYNDELRGNAANNIIEGGAGDDLIVGNQGEDTLTGGTGRDTFVLTTGQGTDTITDFSVNEDSLQLSGGLSFEQLSVMQGTGNNANDSWIISDDNGEQLALLLGVQAATILATETFNQNPVLANNNGLTVDEDATSNITSTQLQVTDADNTSSEITYKVTDTPDSGNLLLNGNNLALNNTFTQADINSNRLTYNHNGSETTSDSFKFEVTDGAGGSIGLQTFNIAVNPVNDAPVANDDNAATLEDNSVTVNVLANDTDSEGNTLNITGIAGSPTGSVTIDGDKIVYNPNGQFEFLNAGESTTDRFTYTVSDGNGLTDTATVTVTINGVDEIIINENPVLASNNGLTVDEDATDNITSTQLQVTDADNTPSEITYKVTDTPDSGNLLLNGNNLALNNTFTQADINSNLLTYNHNGSETIFDSFKFEVTDGAGGSIAQTFDIAVNPVNDAPVAGNDTVTAEENQAVTITVAQLLDNDRDAEDNTLSIASVGNAINGSVVNIKTLIIM